MKIGTAPQVGRLRATVGYASRWSTVVLLACALLVGASGGAAKADGDQRPTDIELVKVDETTEGILCGVPVLVHTKESLPSIRHSQTSGDVSWSFTAAHGSSHVDYTDLQTGEVLLYFRGSLSDVTYLGSEYADDGSTFTRRSYVAGLNFAYIVPGTGAEVSSGRALVHYTIIRDADGNVIDITVDHPNSYQSTPNLEHIIGFPLCQYLGLDRDGDGLMNDEEAALGTNPDSKDTDGDGLSDYDEVKGSTDPLTSDSTDSDGDGLLDVMEVQSGTDPLNPDTDGDGVDDFSEILYGTDPLMLDGDSDGDYDGLTYDQEVALGTNPGSEDTDGDELGDGSEVNEYGTDPLNPDTDGDGLTDGAEVSLHGSDPLTPGTQADSDGDGLLDVDEESLGTDPANPDTDGDGATDYVETVRGTNPLVPDGDLDEDGLTYDQEIAHGTDPVAADTDSDRLIDGDEVNVHGTDPLSADPDGDGLNDSFEIDAGTDPFKADTDRDGFSDFAEVDAGTDPLRRRSHP